MGKIAEEKKKKKKGRPSLLDIQKRTLKQQQQNQPQTSPNPNSKNPNFSNLINSNTNFDSNSRFTRRNNKLDSPERILAGEDEEFDEEDSKREKKFKLVLKLPPQNEGENKKRKIDAIGGRSVVENGEKEENGNFASSDTAPSGMGIESGLITPLPDRKLLVFILDRLQKKDTYGVFSEPVDPKELPDYHDIVVHPMDFGTVRKKLFSGAYANLEQFEKDAFLICSNAMRYNAPDTIYFRQARSIQELAKKDFENLRQDSGDDSESQPKIVRRGRPPTKNLKKRLGRPPIERTGSELSSDATLANAGDNNISSNFYDLRRGPLSGKSGPSDTSSRNYHGYHNSEAFAWLTEKKSEVNDEFPVSMSKGASMKYGKKHFVLDENRRNTYKQSHRLDSGQPPSILATFTGQKKQLMQVGLHMEHCFARSLARFAATLGPVAWKIASKRIERSLPAGVKFGPGWVGENETPPSLPIRAPAHFLPQQSFPLQKISSTTTATTMLAVKVDEDIHLIRTKSPSSVATSFSVVGNISYEPHTERGEITGGLLRSHRTETRPNPPFQVIQGPVLNPSMNGFMSGFRNPSSQMDKLVRPGLPVGDVTSTASIHSEPRTNNDIVQPMSDNHIESKDTKLSGCSNAINFDTSSEDPIGEPQVVTGMGLQQSSWHESSEHQKSDSVPPDLNVRFQSPGSPTSTQRSDLALQL